MPISMRIYYCVKFSQNKSGSVELLGSPLLCQFFLMPFLLFSFLVYVFHFWCFFILFQIINQLFNEYLQPVFEHTKKIVIGCLIKTQSKNTQTIFQGGSPCAALIFNSMFVVLVLYCVQFF